ncbi:MAG TPA: SLBB domain-containing protein [Pyrinomonadaceae bacterium]|nr:SLBB domain-containing protein [Pyrinomonadaceae bacterium]
MAAPSARLEAQSGEPLPQDTAVERIHPGDVIDVDIVGSYEHDWRGTLTPEGFLDGLDELGKQIYAFCRTEEALAAELTREFSKNLRDPVIQVRILDRSNRPEALISGGVQTPSRMQIRRPIRLLEALVLAGGITDIASGEITIFRPAFSGCDDVKNDTEFVNSSTAEPASKTMRINIGDILKGDAAANPIIRSGDIITVLEAPPVYVIGGVNNPGPVQLRTELTLSRAVASAGGVAKNGAPTEITVFRRTEGTSQVISADLNKIEADATLDIALKPYDIIDVPQRGGEKRQFPPVVRSEGTGSPDREKLPLRIID